MTGAERVVHLGEEGFNGKAEESRGIGSTDNIIRGAIGS